MRILFVSPNINPFDTAGYGAVQRSNLLMEACAKCGHVDVVTFVDGVECNNDNCTIVYAKKLCSSIRSSRFMSILSLLCPWNVNNVFPRNIEASNIVEEIIGKWNYDYIVVRYVPEALMCGLIQYADRLVIDVDDDPLEVARNCSKTSKSFRKRLFHSIQVMVMPITLKILYRKIHFAFYSNPEQVNHSRSVCLPNIPFYEVEKAEPAIFSTIAPRILFCGNLNYGSNASGIDRFVSKVFPIIKKSVPNVEFHICGSCNNACLKEKWNNIDGISVMGFVPDIIAEYEQSRVVVVPIFSGAGTNIKVLEAMQMMRPVVTTTCGMRGFYADFLREGGEENVFVTDEETLFAEYVVMLLQEEMLNHSVAKHAQRIVAEKYNRKVFFDIVASVFQ